MGGRGGKGVANELHRGKSANGGTSRETTVHYCETSMVLLGLMKGIFRNKRERAFFLRAFIISPYFFYMTWLFDQHGLIMGDCLFL